VTGGSVKQWRTDRKYKINDLSTDLGKTGQKYCSDNGRSNAEALNHDLELTFIVTA